MASARLNQASKYAALISIALNGCSMPPKSTPAEGARIDLVLNEIKKQIAEVGQYDITQAAKSPISCGALVKAIPQSTTIILKTAVNTTINGNGSGNIPVSYVVISPSLTGSYSKIQTQTVTFDSNIDPTTLAAPQKFLPGDAGPAHAPIDTEAVPNLRTAVLSILQGFLNADHAQRPCLQPQSLKVQADFQVTIKADGGISINFIVAKIGGDVSITNDSTQSVVVTVGLKGSYGLL